MPTILPIRRGHSRDFQIQIRNADGSNASSVYDGTESLTTKVWHGLDYPSIATPTTTWVSATDGTFQISLVDASTSALDFFGYPLITEVSTGGRTFPVFEGVLQVEPSPGTDVLPPVYCQIGDIETYCPQVRSMLDDLSGVAGFHGQRHRARTWFDELVIDRYRPMPGRAKRYLDDAGTAAGPYLQWVAAGPNGEAPPTHVDIQTYLDQDGLRITQKILEANARYAASLIYGAQPGRDNPYTQLASMEAGKAVAIANSAIVKLDVQDVPDGTYTLQVHREAIWLT